MRSTAPVRIHINAPGEEFERFSLDSNIMRPLPITVTLAKNRLTTNVLSSSFDGGQRAAARFSSVSSSYAQFLKQRDMDKVKKNVSSIYFIRFHLVFENSIIRNLIFSYHMKINVCYYHRVNGLKMLKIVIPMFPLLVDLVRQTISFFF
jgi:hypothetical protein